MRHVLVLFAALALGASASAQQKTPTAAEVVEVLGVKTAAVKPQVLAGEFVTVDVEQVHERDLAARMLFLVKKSPGDFTDDLLRDRLLDVVDPATIQMGVLKGEGSLSDFASLKLSPPEKKLYANAKAGSNVNLSTQELASLEALGGDESKVEAQMRKILLGRYQAYKTKGLAGIAPLDRGGDKSDPAADLRKVSEANKALQKFDPGFKKFLSSLPSGAPDDLHEVFHWTRYNAHDGPTLILTHGFSTKIGDAIAAVQRQFYVSRGYNAEQATAGFIPVTQGTLVVYTNHTSTDQVAGFGGSAKRNIGSKLMARTLQDLYNKVRTAAEKK